MKDGILEKLIQIRDSLPKKQRILCDYLLINYEKSGMMTVAELSQDAGVGSTTVMRFIEMLGYDSYSAFKRELINTALMKSNAPYQTLKQSLSEKTQTEGADTLQDIAADGIRVLENLCTPANIEQFDKAVTLLLSAENIYILGSRSSMSLAFHFEYIVDRFYPHVRQLSNQGEFVYDRIYGNMTPRDALLVFSTYPCTLKTIEVTEACHRRGIPFVLITNTSVNPLAKTAGAVIDTNSFNGSSGNTVLFAVVEALGAEIGRRTAPESTQRIEYIERELVEKNLFAWKRY